jgi:hypothetical protein
MKSLYSDLKDLGNLIYINVKANVSPYTNFSQNNTYENKTERITNSIKSKTKKLRKSSKNNSKTKISFKRKPRVKRFKKPIFLNLK